MSSSNSTNYKDFKTFVTYTRFQRYGNLETLETMISQIEAKKQNSSVIVVQGKQNSVPRDVERYVERNLPFQRVGKSDFLTNTKDILNKKGFRIIDFLNVRDELDEEDEFYKDIFLQMLITSEPKLWPIPPRIAKKTNLLSKNLIRLKLLLQAASFSLVPLIVFIILWFVDNLVDIIGFAADPQSQTYVQEMLSEVNQWLKFHPYVSYLLLIIILIIWGIYVWRKLKSNSNLYDIWQTVAAAENQDEIESLIKEFLLKNPQKILETLCKKNSRLAFIIDDIDLLETSSFQLLENLYNQAKKMSKCLSIFVLAYNPQNPILHRSNRTYIRDTLDTMGLSEKKWDSIELSPPTWGDVNSFLCTYYQDQNLVALTDGLKQYFSEIADNPSFFLTFFVKSNFQQNEISELTIDEVLERLKLFLGRNRKMAQQFIDGIKEYDSSLGSDTLELLKFILAFKRRSVQVEELKNIMEKEGYSDFNSYLNVLLSSEPRLLEKEQRNNQTFVKFQKSHYRSIITSGWTDWQNQSHNYYSIVLDTINKTYPKESYKVALDASPSMLAIDILYRYGEYLYKYQGSTYSDVGYALEFVGYEENNRGALAKWLKLFHQTSDEGGDLLRLIESPSNVHGYLGYEHSFFAPDLILLTGLLYKMAGKWKYAYTIWVKEWSLILEKLELESKPPELQTKLTRLNTEIHRNLAEMLFTVGYAEDTNANLSIEFWKDAKKIASSLRDEFPSTFEMIRALVNHYKDVGIGNLLSPYHFLIKESDLKHLTKALERIGETPCLERIRLLCLIANEYWQIICYHIKKADNQFNLLKLEIKEIKRFDSEIEKLIEAFKKCINLNYKTLLSFINMTESKTKKRQDGAYDRVLQGDIFYWEAIHLLMVTRLFQIETIRIAGQFSGSLKDRGSGAKRKKRVVKSATTIIDTMREICLLQVTKGKKLPPNFEEIYTEFEKLEMKAQTANDNELIDLSIKIRNILPKVYKTGLNDLIDMIKNQFHLSEAVYRQLGYRSKIATAKFTQSQLLHEFQVSSTWVDEAEYALKWASDELGYHLDILRNHLMIAQEKEDYKPRTAIKKYLTAQKYLNSKDLNLPSAFANEVNYKIATIMGNITISSPYSIDDLITRFNKSKENYYQLQVNKNAKLIDANFLQRRLLDCHCWLAELNKRLVYLEIETSPQREKYIKDSIDETGYVLKITQNTPNLDYEKNIARIIRASVLYAHGQLLDAFDEAKKAKIYFSENKNTDHLIQSLEPIILCLFHEDNIIIDNKNEARGKYLIEFVKIIDEQIGNQENLNALNKTVLYRAITILENTLNRWSVLKLLKNVFPEYSKFKSSDELKLYFYNIIFDILESLGQYATAIKLYNQVKPIYEKNLLTLGTDFEIYKRRIIEVAKQFNPSSENITYADFSWIIRDCSNITLAPSKSNEAKQETLQRVQKIINDGPEKISEGIAILGEAEKSIDFNELEDVDLDILTLLKTSLYQTGEAKKAEEVEKKLERVKSTIQSRDFFLIAKHLEEQDRDFIWALKIAVKVKAENKFSREARLLLMAQNENEAIDVIDITNVKNEQLIIIPSDLLELPIHELTDTDVRTLFYDVFEKKLRELIATELSEKSTNWWRERIPQDPRDTAEKRKKDVEESKKIAGFKYYDRDPIEYLHFPHYSEIIRFKVNWNDTFRFIFEDKEKIRLQFQDIFPGRNSLSHSRPLEGDERNIFVVNIRRILRQIYNYEKQKTVTDTIQGNDLDENKTQNYNTPKVDYTSSDIVELASNVFTTEEILLKFIESNDKFQGEWSNEIPSMEDRKEIIKKFVYFCQQNNLIEDFIEIIKKQFSKKYGKWYAILKSKSNS